MRQDLLLQLKKRWQNIDGADKIEDVTLHYLHGQVHIDIQVPLSAIVDLDQARGFSNEVSMAIQEIGAVGDVQINFFERADIVQK